MNTSGFCPFCSIENDVLLAQVIRPCICLSFSSVFLIVGLKKKQLLLVPLSKDLWASSDYPVFDTESRLIQCSVYWAYLPGRRPFTIVFMFKK